MSTLKRLVPLPFAFAGLLASPGLSAQESEGSAAEALTLESVPPAVRATIQREAAGDPIESIGTVLADGQTVYDVMISHPEGAAEIIVEANGHILLRPSPADDDDDDHDHDHSVE